MSYSEEMVLEMEDEWPSPVIGEVSCAMTDLGRVALLALGAVVVAAALGVWALRRMRPW
jgi:hypothetical protein